MHARGPFGRVGVGELVVPVIDPRREPERVVDVGEDEREGLDADLREPRGGEVLGQASDEGAVPVAAVAPQATHRVDELGPDARHRNDEGTLVGVGDDDPAAGPHDAHHLGQHRFGVVEVLEDAVGACCREGVRETGAPRPAGARLRTRVRGP